MFIYSYVVERDDNDTWLISFPDVPEAISYAQTEDVVPVVARDVLWTELDAYMRDRRPLPKPTPAKERPVVDLGPRMNANLGLHQAMVEQGVTRAELARRLGVAPTQASRLLDLTHKSTLDQIIDALHAVNSRLQIYVERIPVPRVAVQRRKPGQSLPIAKRRRARGGPSMQVATHASTSKRRRSLKRAHRDVR